MSASRRFVAIFSSLGLLVLVLAVVVPNFLRSRKRARATQVLQDLRMIDAAIDQYVIENNKSGGTVISWAELSGYLKSGSRLPTQPLAPAPKPEEPK
jgi:type II secretory pathway pseudopilin PulG